MLRIAIEQARKACRLSRTELARQVGVSRYAIWLWERGLRVPNIQHLKKLIEVLPQLRSLPLAILLEEGNGNGKRKR